MKTEATCPIDGTVFTVQWGRGHGRTLYCSEACQKAGQRLAKQRWDERNPDYARNMKYTDLNVSRWVEFTLRQIADIERFGGHYYGRSQLLALGGSSSHFNAPFADELRSLCEARREVEFVRGAHRIATPPIHPMDDPDYYERDFWMKTHLPLSEDPLPGSGQYNAWIGNPEDYLDVETAQNPLRKEREANG